MNTNGGYAPKNLIFKEQARKKLIKGISTMSEAVKSTLGPNGNTVLIESPSHTHGITVTKDGVTVAKSVDLMDPVENLAVRMMKEAADRTATSAGDGTTTAIVLTEALVFAGLEYITDKLNRTEVLRQLSILTDKTVKELKKKSKKLNKKMLLDVATISANNDHDTGDIISQVYKQVGDTGVVTVEKAKHQRLMRRLLVV
jgi:chaperonin GroEL